MPPLNRREFLIQGGIFAACLAALSAAPLGLWQKLFSLGQKSKRQLQSVPVISLNELKQKKIVETEVLGKPVIVVDDGKTIRALSAICSHARCTVKWNASENLLVCPCHDGAYNLQGRVKRQPPVMDLVSYPAQVQKDQVFIQI